MLALEQSPLERIVAAGRSAGDDALLDRPVIVGSDPRWLAFPAEREHARLAEALFDGRLDSGTFRQRAAGSGIRYLVVAKWDWIGWERWLTTPGFPVAKLYDDDRYLYCASPNYRQLDETANGNDADRHRAGAACWLPPGVDTARGPLRCGALHGAPSAASLTRTPSRQL